jgi:alkylated DNA repair protein (DNA oxidative demethylase)
MPRAKPTQSELLLLSNDPTSEPAAEELLEGFTFLRGFCLPQAAALIQSVADIAVQSPFRHMVVPGGHQMSVAMTNCGGLGWISDPTGYRYTATDPLTSKPWPLMPGIFQQIARHAAATAGFHNFTPNGCLINRYAPGARLSLHQDKNERDYTQPIVSVSLGLPATFLLGTLKRSDTPRRIRVEHGDVAVWGGPARLVYHGVAPLRDGLHPETGPYRINLTFRSIAP